MTENQGVCIWAVPLDAGDEPPVLVVPADATPGGNAVVYANESHLSNTFRPAVTTWNWPARRAPRFESVDGFTLTVWDGPEQCDWWISSPHAETTRQRVAELLPYSDLADSFWSDDDGGIALLQALRTP